MKKLLAVLIVTTLLSFGAAQSSGFGLYSGWPTWIGAQFQTGPFRVGAGLSGFGFGGDVAYMISKNALPAAPGFDLNWYFGAGAGVGFWAVSGFTGIYLFPHGLVGLEYQFPGMPFSAYGEGQLGVGIGLGDLAGWRGFGLDFGGRVGIIFRQ
jgi:hypothetical protein